MKKGILITCISILVIVLLVVVYLIMGVKDSEDTVEISSSENEIIEENETVEEIEEETIEVDENEIGEDEYFDWMEYSDEPTVVTNETYFYTVQECILRYIETVLELNDEYSERSEQEIRTAIYNILSSDYIEENNIEIENVEQYSNLENYKSFVTVETMVELYIEDNSILRYAARCMIVNSENEIDYLNFIVYIDSKNVTYAICPIDNVIEKLGKVDLKSDITEIESNDDNVFEHAIISTSTLISNYVEVICYLCLNYPEVAYEYLQQDEFDTVDSFKEYIEENREKFENVSVEDYLMNYDEENDNSEYTCYTESELQIEITESAIMQITFEIW